MFDRLKKARLRSLDKSIIITALPMAVSAFFAPVRALAFALGIFFIIMLYARIRLGIKYRQLKKSFPADLNAECESCAESVLPCYFFLRDGFLEAANAYFIGYSDIELVEAATFVDSKSGKKNYRFVIKSGGKRYLIMKIGREGEEAQAFAEMCRLFAAHIPADRIKTDNT